MIKALIFVLILPFSVFAQREFRITNASQRYDVRYEIEKCDKSRSCAGKVKAEIYNKKERHPFQTIRLKNSAFYLGDDNLPIVNKKEIPYGEYSVLYLEDFDFDGHEDLALRDGNNGGYGGPSYQIYLYSSSQKKFFWNPEFTKLTQGLYLGMFDVNKKKRTLTTFWKSTCCEHHQEVYRPVKGKPKLIRSVAEYSGLPPEPEFIVTETKVLMNGRWRTWTKRTKITEKN